MKLMLVLSRHSSAYVTSTWIVEKKKYDFHGTSLIITIKLFDILTNCNVCTYLLDFLVHDDYLGYYIFVDYSDISTTGSVFVECSIILGDIIGRYCYPV